MNTNSSLIPSSIKPIKVDAEKAIGQIIIAAAKTAEIASKSFFLTIK